jgi:hypothetical protein
MAAKKKTPPPMVAPRTKAPKDMARPKPKSPGEKIVKEAKKIGKAIGNIGSTTPARELEQKMLNDFRGSAAEAAGLSFDEYKKLVQVKKVK